MVCGRHGTFLGQKENLRETHTLSGRPIKITHHLKEKVIVSNIKVKLKSKDCDNHHRNMPGLRSISPPRCTPAPRRSHYNPTPSKHRCTPTPRRSRCTSTPRTELHGRPLSVLDYLPPSLIHHQYHHYHLP